MPYAKAADVQLYYEEAGKGIPIVWVHEFADDLRGWEAQMQFFSRRYRSVAYNARGYPPSDVPNAPSKYSQVIPAADTSDNQREQKQSEQTTRATAWPSGAGATTARCHGAPSGWPAPRCWSARR